MSPRPSGGAARRSARPKSSVQRRRPPSKRRFGFLKTSLENYQTFARLPATAATIKAVEELMELPAILDHRRYLGDLETLTREQLRAMQNDPKYTGERGKDIDPSFVNRVRAGYRALSKNGSGR
jgi:hypothetical protein